MKLIRIELTIQEIWNAMRTSIRKNKKKYNRKTKHKNKKHNA